MNRNFQFDLDIILQMYTSVQFLYPVLTSQSDLPGYKLNFVVWDEYNLDVNNNFSMKKKISNGSMHYYIYLTYSTFLKNHKRPF